jgi:hypothetical protein
MTTGTSRIRRASVAPTAPRCTPKALEAGREDVESPRNAERRGRSSEALDAGVALGRLGEPRAVPTLVATRDAWAVASDVDQMVEQRDRALAALAAPGPAAERPSSAGAASDLPRGGFRGEGPC